MIFLNYVRVFVLSFFFIVCTPIVSAEEKGPTTADTTGTDPRDFSSKFMPYYRSTELENGMEIKGITMFGMVALSKSLALTYEVPFNYIDARDMDGISSARQDSGFDSPAFPPTNSNFQQTGVGDTNLRLFTNLGEGLGMSWLGGAEVWLPTHSDEFLGADRLTVAPMVANVLDLTFLPMPNAFMAMMHFYEFDIAKDSDEADVSRYKGRWFFMIPLNERYKIYSLTEMQPVYDFEEDHFSFWLGVEIGTAALGEGIMLYAKPGWGFDPDAANGDRDFTLEIGFRYFL